MNKNESKIALYSVLLGAFISLAPNLIFDLKNHHYHIANKWHLLKMEAKVIVEECKSQRKAIDRFSSQPKLLETIKLYETVPNRCELNAISFPLIVPSLRTLPSTVWNSTIIDSEFMPSAEPNTLKRLFKGYSAVKQINSLIGEFHSLASYFSLNLKSSKTIKFALREMKSNLSNILEYEDNEVLVIFKPIVGELERLENEHRNKALIIESLFWIICFSLILVLYKLLSNPKVN